MSQRRADRRRRGDGGGRGPLVNNAACRLSPAANSLIRVDRGRATGDGSELPRHFAVTQAFAPVLAKNGGGAIANLNSWPRFVSFPILAAYSASKAATHSLTQATRAMLGGRTAGVCVYPARLHHDGAGADVEKASPADAARAIVAGIIAGDEEIFPDRK